MLKPTVGNVLLEGVSKLKHNQRSKYRGIVEVAVFLSKDPPFGSAQVEVVIFLSVAL